MTAPVRVCLVGPSLDILGGQAIQLDRLRRRLEMLPGIEVSFIPVNPRLPGPFRLLQRIRYVRTVFTSIAYLLSLLVKLRKVDVVHAFSASYWSFLLAPVPAIIVSRIYGRPVILNYRSGEAADHLATWRTAVPLMRLATRIVVPSGYLVEVFARHGLDAQSIFNFVESESIPWRERPKPQPVFFSNRNLEPMYNVECTLRAFDLIQERHPGARLVVAGDGSERAHLERLAASLALNGVTFTGKVAPAGMARLYDEADVYFNSPDIDNMPNSVIESFAAGLPVVTTDAGGIPFIVRHESNGLVVRCGDHQAMAAAALRLLDEPDLSLRLVRQAREEVFDRYVWPAVSPQWHALYTDLAARAGRVAAPAGGAERA
ncbi:MAG: glycosyltransferase family 4 protein [Gemmatimonadota bacterium]